MIAMTWTPISLAQYSESPSNVVDYGEVMIESDSQSTDSLSDIFTAHGNVRIFYPEKGISATARQLQYLKNEQIVVLLGDVDLSRAGRERLYGERVVIFLNKDQLIADSYPEKQVLLKFHLDQNKQSEVSSSL